MPNPENIEPFRWKPGQSGNLKGRKPKVLGAVLKELKEAGYVPVTKEEITEAFTVVMNMEEQEIADMVQDKAQPMLMRIVGRKMMAKDGHEMLEKMLDRAHGKAKQQVDHLSGGEKIVPIVNLNHISLDDLRRLAEDPQHRDNDPDGSKS